MLVVNLPVHDVVASASFYRGLGFEVDEEYCEEEAASVKVGPSVVVMLLSRDRFAQFVGADPAALGRPTPALNSLSADSRAEVDAMFARAIGSGGSSRTLVAQGPLYGRSFADPDGHVWEVLHLGTPRPPDGFSADR
jgi:predicted lactoylglutathione lyase